MSPEAALRGKAALPQEAALPVLVLFGPTASGKTEILESLFAGEGARFLAEVVSADSMQVYRGMDVGTAKPDVSTRSRLPHHLIDIRNPDEQFSVGDFIRLADVACHDIVERGRIPVVSGGTGFYLKHFLLGLPAAPPSDPAVRTALQAELAARGLDALAGELAAVDPESAERIHANDEYRILRALEVFRVSGLPRSSFSAAGRVSDAEKRPSYRFLVLGLRRNRAELYRRIDERAHRMFQYGLPEEVARLVEAGYGSTDPGLKAIGYREFFLEDGSIKRDHAEVEALVARDSRRYAKRQQTFFASIPGVRWIDFDEPQSSAIESITRELDTFLANASLRGAGP